MWPHCGHLRVVMVMPSAVAVGGCVDANAGNLMLVLNPCLLERCSRSVDALRWRRSEGNKFIELKPLTQIKQTNSTATKPGRNRDGPGQPPRGSEVELGAIGPSSTSSSSRYHVLLITITPHIMLRTTTRSLLRSSPLQQSQRRLITSSPVTKDAASSAKDAASSAKKSAEGASKQFANYAEKAKQAAGPLGQRLQGALGGERAPSWPTSGRAVC